MSRTLAQKTNFDGFPKAAELIEMKGTHALEASDRLILNVLLQYAHDSGRMAEPGAEWEIPLTLLRQSRHESNDRIRDSLQRLTGVSVTLAYMAENDAGKAQECRVMISGLFEGFDISAEEFAARATLRFGVSRKLGKVLEQSKRWGRIRSEVIYAMTSKYAIALYELVQLRANLERCVEVFSLEHFRELLGVPPGAYGRGNSFQQFVVDPAVLEVNGLSDMGVKVDLRRRHKRAPIHEVEVYWYRQDGDAFKAVLEERMRSKVGRMVRLKMGAGLMPEERIVESPILLS